LPLSEEKIKSELDSIYSFANLHRWSAQLNRKIETFLDKLGTKDAKTVHSVISSSFLDAGGTKEQLVLSVVLLNKLGLKSLETVELLYDLLEGRLDNNDQSFLQYQLFNDNHPLPDDLSYEITSRPYLSLKRAINRAMKIEKVKSHFSPEATAFYLTMIFCRVDLNEQNRAMLSFLISRIDAQLPKNVMHGIFAYLRNLKNIIKELEDKGEKTLTEEFHYADEPDMRHKKDYSESSVQETEHDNPQVDQEQTETQREREKDRKAGETEDDVSAVEEAAEESEAQLEREQFLDERGRGLNLHEEGDVHFTKESSLDEKKQTERAEVKPTEEHSEETDKRTQKIERGDAAYAGSENQSERTSHFEEGKRVGSEDSSEAWSGKESLDRVEDLQDESNAEQTKDSRYTIHFSRNTEELLMIIDDLETEEESVPEKPVIPEAGPSEEAEQNEEPQPETHSGPFTETETETGTETETEGQQPEGRKRNMLFAGMAAAAVVLLGVFLFIGTQADENSSEAGTAAAGQKTYAPTQEGTVAEAQEEPGAVAPPEGPLKAPSETGPSVDITTGQGPPSTRFEITSGGSENNGPVWSVNEGEYMWSLFQAAQEGGIPRAGGETYSIPADVTWMEFIMDAFAVNPGLDQFELIYPEQNIQLPTY